MANTFESTFQSQVVPAAQRAFGVSVTLTRGALVTESFTARRNDLEYKAIGQDFGLEISLTMRDFILPVASLVLDGVTVEPRKGDLITEGSEQFEVSPPDDSRPAVELQPGGYEWLVHTSRVT